MTPIPEYETRTFCILKMDVEGDIAKVFIPVSIAPAIGHIIVLVSKPIDIDAIAFPFDDPPISCRSLFGDNIKDVMITEAWKTKDHQIKIISFEETVR